MSINLDLADLELRVKKLEEQNLFLRNKVIELEGRRTFIDLSQKQKEQLRGYHEGHEEQQGYDHYEPDHEDDGEALASAGFGTDEDYGFYSEEGSDRL